MEINMQMEALKTQLIQEKRLTASLSKENKALRAKVASLQKDSNNLRAIRQALR